MPVSRRRFCQSGAAVGVIGLLPSACSNKHSSAAARAIPARIPVVKLSGEAASVEGAAVRELAESLAGELLLSGDFGYDGARRIWNGMHDRYPALIVRAQSTADVLHAVEFARERELLLAVKGGGHSWPGRSVADGALMIDLSALDDVIVDPATRRTRVGGGALLYDLDFAALPHNLATTAGIVSHTGVGGLTLGGGYGRLGRKFGLTIDSLLSAEIVTASGQALRLSAGENEDLFWAVRGGGGNFGVVTEFEFALHETPPDMYGGVMQWPLARAREVLDYYAENSADFSRDMFMAPGVVTGADGAAWLAMDVCYCGDPRDAERELAPLRAIARPAMDGAVPTAYLTMQTRMDGIARPGIRSYIKSGMVREFTPALIDTILEAFEPGRGVIINSFATGGAIAEVAETATAWPHRNAHSMIAALSFWSDASLDESRIGATRALWAELERHTGGYYANIQADDINVAGNFGPVYERLVSIKNRYDPMNLFRLNSNIEPTV
ncbi:MAG: FAD-binding oxidoreductase [Woeseiaceae bacterium]